jgi:hypothetical protein
VSADHPWGTQKDIQTTRPPSQDEGDGVTPRAALHASRPCGDDPWREETTARCFPIAGVTRKRIRRLTFDAELYERKVFVPEYLEEIYDFPDGNFSLFHRGSSLRSERKIEGS